MALLTLYAARTRAECDAYAAETKITGLCQINKLSAVNHAERYAVQIEDSSRAIADMGAGRYARHANDVRQWHDDVIAEISTLRAARDALAALPTPHPDALSYIVRMTERYQTLVAWRDAIRLNDYVSAWGAQQADPNMLITRP